MKRYTLQEIRETVGPSQHEREMLAAINGAATLCGDDLKDIATVLWSALVVICAATGSGPAMMAIFEGEARANRAAMEAGTQPRTGN